MATGSSKKDGINMAQVHVEDILFDGTAKVFPI